MSERRRWESDSHGYARGSVVRVEKTPGVWVVFGPSEVHGNLYLEPRSMVADRYARRFKSGMLNAPHELLELVPTREAHTP